MEIKLMTKNTNTDELINLTADVVSAYVSNNTVVASALPALIATVSEALARGSPKSFSTAQRRADAGCSDQEVRNAGLYRLPG